jgi:hypothetical protein
LFFDAAKIHFFLIYATPSDFFSFYQNNNGLRYINKPKLAAVL